jgi:hypothetical protein
MTKQQQTRLTEAAIEKGIIPLQSLEWHEACTLALEYHAAFKKRKRQKEESELYRSLVDIWLKEVHPGWGFRAIDGASINIIISKMQAWIANPNNVIPVVIDKNYFENFFRHFCKKLPEFYKNQTLNVLAHKFDSIIEEIKTQNGRKRIVQKGVERLSDFAR